MDIGYFLKLMTEKGASDMFLTTGAPVNIKVEGKLYPLGNTGMPNGMVKKIAYSLMDEGQVPQFERDLELNMAIAVKEAGRFRVNVFKQRGEVGMVIRAIKSEIPTIEQLKLPPVLKDIIMEPRGLVLVVGSTGSGKSTSLAAMIDHRNASAYDHIVTIEDPVEFVHPHKNSIVTQREVGIDTLSWEAALKNTLRQAPDVILMGEIRDRETMQHAVAFAETGHLCMATLHANNANQALDRIVNFFPEERRDQLLMDLSLNLRAMISQRLVPRQDGSGRIAAVEVLINGPHISDLIFRGEVSAIKEIMKRSRENGMQTFDQALFDLYEGHFISEEDALRHADSLGDLRLEIKLRSVRKAGEPLPLEARASEGWKVDDPLGAHPLRAPLPRTSRA